MVRMTMLLLPLLLLSSSACVLDSAKSLIQGFYTAYSGSPFTASGCLSDSQKTDLAIEAQAIVQDFTEEHDFATFFSHTLALYQDLQATSSSCGLTSLNTHLVTYIQSEGLPAFLSSINTNSDVLLGYAIQFIQNLLSHSFEEAGATLGQATAVVIPPEINVASQGLRRQKFDIGLQGINVFHKLSNFTYGFFLGLQANPKKVPTCFTSYNYTRDLFRNDSAIFLGCVELYMQDCSQIPLVVSDIIVNVQAMLITCHMDELLYSIENLGDPTEWTSILTAFTLNMDSIISTFNDLKQSVVLGNYKQSGYDLGSMVKVLLNFKLT